MNCAISAPWGPHLPGSGAESPVAAPACEPFIGDLGVDEPSAGEPELVCEANDDPFDDFEEDDFDDDFDDDFEEDWEDDLTQDDEFPDTFGGEEEVEEEVVEGDDDESPFSDDPDFDD